MWQKFSTFLIACGIAAASPLDAIAQSSSAVPQPASWPGLWFLWGDGWWFWLVCPLMMVGMMLVCGLMSFGHRSSRLH